MCEFFVFGSYKSSTIFARDVKISVRLWEKRILHVKEWNRASERGRYLPSVMTSLSVQFMPCGS